MEVPCNIVSPASHAFSSSSPKPLSHLVVDSGASKHMSGTRERCIEGSYKTFAQLGTPPIMVRFGNGQLAKAEGTFSMPVPVITKLGNPVTLLLYQRCPPPSSPPLLSSRITRPTQFFFEAPIRLLQPLSVIVNIYTIPIFYQPVTNVPVILLADIEFDTNAINKICQDHGGSQHFTPPHSTVNFFPIPMGRQITSRKKFRLVGIFPLGNGKKITGDGCEITGDGWNNGYKKFLWSPLFPHTWIFFSNTLAYSIPSSLSRPGRIWFMDACNLPP